MYYVAVIKELSSGSLEKTFTSYDSKDTAIRKYHEAFNTVGGGPNRITSMLFEDIVNNPDGSKAVPNTIDTIVLKNETWTLEPENNSTTE